MHRDAAHACYMQASNTTYARVQGCQCALAEGLGGDQLVAEGCQHGRRVFQAVGTGAGEETALACQLQSRDMARGG